MDSIFSEDWRDCLAAHYTYVIRENDQRTERSLRGVLINAGFNEDALKQIIIQATAHVDDVSADFVPDFALLEPEPEASFSIAVPQEVIEAELVEQALASDEAADADTDPDAAVDDDSPPNDDPGITQLSLF
jgi:hypothetical protein